MQLKSVKGAQEYTGNGKGRVGDPENAHGKLMSIARAGAMAGLYINDSRGVKESLFKLCTPDVLKNDGNNHDHALLSAGSSRSD